jgi:dynein heavy chain
MIASNLFDLYLKINPIMPILQSLKNPDLKKEHFEDFKQRYGIEIEKDLKTKFPELEKQGILNYINDIVEMSALATKERKLEQQLNKIIDQWKTVEFTLDEYKNTGCLIMKGVQDIWDLLDQHIQEIMIIAASPYAKLFAGNANYWKSRFIAV